MLKAIAIDDEPIALEVIRALASKVGFLELAGVYTDAYEAMKVYLLKPFSQSRFLKACNKAYELYELKRRGGAATAIMPEDVFVKIGYGQVRVKLDDILYLQSTGNYMQFVLQEEKLLSRLTMAEAEALLPSPAFIRIHRSYLVASGKVDRIERDTVWIGNRELPVGAGYAREVGKITARRDLRP
jgi:DNA-binding LytR/AlgR family response regulator